MQYNLTNIVEELLTENANMRDNDEALFLGVIEKYALNPATMNVSQCMLLIAIGRLPAFDHVQRVRRAVQERRADLRGRRYAERQAKAGHIITGESTQ